MTQQFVEDIEKVINSNPIILSSNIQKHFGPDGNAVYLRGNLLFVDASVLEIAIFAEKSQNKIHILKYRFHYMDKQGLMFFRYDNAPHHNELSSFPHHKHTRSSVTSASLPNIKNILNEISAIILKK